MKIQVVYSESFRFSLHSDSEGYESITDLVAKVAPGTKLHIRDKGHRDWSDIVFHLKAMKIMKGGSDFDFSIEAILPSSFSSSGAVCVRGISMAHLMSSENLFSAQSCGHCLKQGQDVYVDAHTFLDDYISAEEVEYAPGICLTVWIVEEREIDDDILRFLEKPKQDELK